MLCPSCGSEVPDNVRLCPSCGGSISAETDAEETRREESTRSTPQPATTAASASPTELTSAEKRRIALAQATQEGLDMGWYKFVIYFLLFASGATCILLGCGKHFSALILSSYNITSPSSTILTVFGNVYFVFAALYVLLRTRMARFSKNAPRLLSVVYGINFGFSALTLTYYSSFESDLSSMLVATLAGIGFLAANTSYFKKRAHLFVND